ncbi:MAG: DUF305 domain-containing protein [Solirubrobacteraceae bacterium]|nr:DUF305 domain-containing protein [Solirubrobacteraceae bacterium]
MTSTPARLLTAVTCSLALAGGLAACGDDDSSTTSTSSGGAPAATASKAPGTPAQVDAAFVRQMIPHHEMAVDMAEPAGNKAEHDEVKTLAANITKSQNAEIQEMQAIAKDLGTTGDTRGGQMAADAKTLGLSMNEMGMNMHSGSLDDADPFDRAFIDEMIPHHEGAIAMANVALQSGSDERIKKLATAIVAAQTAEIADMKAWRTAWYGDAEPSTSSQMKDEGEMDHSHMGH